MTLSLLHILVFASGCAVLMYQTLWLRSFSLIFGGTTQAASLVLAVFMGGLALGSWACGKFRPARVLPIYALVEFGIGLGALLTLPLLRGLPAWSAGLPQGPTALLGKAGLACLVLLPATFLAGATMPLAVEYATRQGRSFRTQFGALYLSNTAGAAAGVLASTFVLVPALGLSGSLVLASLFNFSAAVFSWKAGRGEAAIQPESAPVSSVSIPISTFLLPGTAAFASGASAFLLEILWMRSLSLTLGNSVYSFNLMLLALLAGLVLGTGLYGLLRPRMADPRRWLAAGFLATGCLVLFQLYLLGRLPAMWLATLRNLPLSFASHQLAGLALSFLALLPVACLQGFTFPLLAHLQKASSPPQQTTGRLYVFNTLGAIAGSLSAGFFLIQAFGLQACFVLAAAPLLFLGTAMLPDLQGPARKAGALGCTLLVLVPAFLFWRPWDPYLMSSGVYLYGKKQVANCPPDMAYGQWLRGNGNKTVFYREGPESVVTVKEFEGIRSLQVNGKTDAGTGLDNAAQKLLGHLPFLISPQASRALVIGWGSGATAASASRHGLTDLVCAELEPATVEAAPYFEKVNFGLKPGKGFSLAYEDGRSHLLETKMPYDLIISEPSNPWIHGVSNLFTLEFYEIARSRMGPKGVFCQWFHFYAMGTEDLKSQLATFCRVFPHASLWIVPSSKGMEGMTLDLILLGSLEPQDLSFAAAGRLLADPRIKDDLAGADCDSPEGLLASCLTDRQGMLEVAGSAPLNTDDRPRLEFSAPRFLYLDPDANEALKMANRELLDKASCAFKPPWVVSSKEAPRWAKLSQDRSLFSRARMFQ